MAASPPAMPDGRQVDTGWPYCVQHINRRYLVAIEGTRAKQRLEERTWPTRSMLPVVRAVNRRQPGYRRP